LAASQTWDSETKLPILEFGTSKNDQSPDIANITYEVKGERQTKPVSSEKT